MAPWFSGSLEGPTGVLKAVFVLTIVAPWFSECPEHPRCVQHGAQCCFFLEKDGPHNLFYEYFLPTVAGVTSWNSKASRQPLGISGIVVGCSCGWLSGILLTWWVFGVLYAGPDCGGKSTLGQFLILYFLRNLLVVLGFNMRWVGFLCRASEWLSYVGIQRTNG